jgi:hypothetical protein
MNTLLQDLKFSLRLLTPAVLFVTAMVDCWLRTEKATRVSPLKALRSE